MLDRSTPFVALLLLAACSDVGDGVRAYRAGNFEEAHAAFAAAEERAGDGASAALLYDRSLAALRVGELDAAESAAVRAADRDPDFAGRRDFLLGNVSFARCELAETQANSPEAEPFAFDVAIRYGEAARDAWGAAAASRNDWPEARRNVERALLKIADLRRQQAARDPNSKKAPDAPTPPRPAPPTPPPTPTAGPDAEQPPDAPGPGADGTPDAEPGAVVAELTPEQVRRLFETLAAKEREKLDVRRERRRTQPPEVTRDW